MLMEHLQCCCRGAIRRATTQSDIDSKGSPVFDEQSIGLVLTDSEQPYKSLWNVILNASFQ